MSSIRPPHPDPLVDAARPPLASGVRVLGRHFFAHPERVTPFDDDELEPTTIAVAVDAGGREWELVWSPLTRELYGYARSADAVYGLAALDPNLAADLIAAVRARADGFVAWEDVVSFVLARRESNLGRVIRVRVELDVQAVGWVAPEFVVEALARLANADLPALRARLVTWAEHDAEPVEAPADLPRARPGRLVESSSFVDTAGRTYVGSVDGARVVVIDPDGSEAEYRYVAGVWHSWHAGEPVSVVEGSLVSLLTRASMIARGEHAGGAR